MGHEALANIWAVLIALMLALYVTLDGFDLGIGMLSLLVRGEEDRSAMMQSIAAVWDANETWLVVAGGALFGAFPTVYAVVLNALYLPAALMLFGLIFRAVSFEFRGRGPRKRLWGLLFGVGSLAAVAGQGLLLGGLLSGPSVEGGVFGGGVWDWLNVLSLVTMVAVALGYATLGAAYLQARLAAPLRDYAHKLLIGSSVLMFAAIVAATVLLPVLTGEVSRRWAASPTRDVLVALAAGAAFAFVVLMLATVYRRHTIAPLLASLAMSMLAFAGLGVAVYPYLVPGEITIVQGAAEAATLKFMLWGIGPIVPAMLLYNLYLYRVFALRPGGPQEREEY